MYISGIDFPDKIVKALNEGTLLVFVGAGVSMGAPTSLPHFTKLTQNIAEGSGYSYSDKDQLPQDQFLGQLESKGIDVHGIASHLLSNMELKPNDLHRHILNLFSGTNSIRIITTNYDEMLEKAANELKIHIPVFNAPALPLGDDIYGIVHLHGNVDNTKYMVLTDSDFGKAYFLEGYTSRFLIKAFQSYTTLFIGYSYNDIVMRYLTRSLPNSQTENRYILTDNANENWRYLGISPIFYKPGDYETLYYAVQNLGLRNKRGLFDWRTRLSTLGQQPPKSTDAELIDEILEAAKDTSLSRLLTSNIHSTNWMQWLDEHHIFDCLFDSSASLNETDQIWIQWLVERFIVEHDEDFLLLLQKHNCTLHQRLADCMIGSLINKKDQLNNIQLIRYIIILFEYLSAPYLIGQIVSVLCDKELYSYAWKCFKKLLSYKMVLKQDELWSALLSGKPNLGITHQFVGEAHPLQYTWDNFLKQYIQKLGTEPLQYCSNLIEQLSCDYQYFLRNKEPYELASCQIESTKKHLYHKDALPIVCQILENIFSAIEQSETSFCKLWLDQKLCSSSVLMRRIALKSLRETKFYTADQKIELALNTFKLYSYDEKEQLFLLMKNNFNDASPASQNTVINRLKTDASLLDDSHPKDYCIYNWFIWLNQIAPENMDITNILQEITKRHPDFALLEHPELDMYISNGISLQMTSPIAGNEFLNLTPQECYNYIKECVGKDCEKTNRRGILNLLSKASCEHHNFISQFIAEQIKQNDYSSDVWEAIFSGLEKAIFTEAQWITILHQLENDTLFHQNTLWICRIIEKYLSLKSVKILTPETWEYIYSLSIQLLNSINHITCTEYDNWLSETLRHPSGKLTYIWMMLIQMAPHNDLFPSRFKELFESILNDKSNIDIGYFRCSICTYFAFLNARDSNWCEIHLLDYFKNEQPEIFKQAWSGFLWETTCLEASLAKLFEPLFFNALPKLNYLDKKAQLAFVKKYTFILVYYTENPLTEHIPNLITKCGQENRIAFIHCILRCLDAMTMEQKNELWTRWLRKYWELRIKNSPCSLETYEVEAMMQWLLSLGELFPDVVELVIQQPPPAHHYFNIVHLLENWEGITLYPNASVKLLLYILKAEKDCQWHSKTFQNIFVKLSNADLFLRNQLEEIYLKKGISI